MDVQKKLDEIVDTVGSARSMPMSASCVINRAELLALLEEVREALPGSLAQAQELIGDREQLVEQARQEAERIIQSAHAERGTLVSGTAVAQRSQDEADRILAEARAEAEEIRAQADDYVDSKLANFEVVLTKTIGSVGRGREKLLGADLAADDGYEDPDAPERSHDPETLRRRADDYVSAKLGAFEAVLGKTLEAVGRGRRSSTAASPPTSSPPSANSATRPPRPPPATPTTSPPRGPRHPAAPGRDAPGTPVPAAPPPATGPVRLARPRPLPRTRTATAPPPSRTPTPTSSRSTPRSRPPRTATRTSSSPAPTATGSRAVSRGTRSRATRPRAATTRPGTPYRRCPRSGPPTRSTRPASSTPA
ncbi:hypothetical protein ACFQVA_31385 [Actinomadura keratinilytica]